MNAIDKSCFHNYSYMYVIVCGPVPWLYQYWPGGFMVLWFYVQEHPKAQQTVVLVLKCLRRRGNGLKSHPKDWEKPGIEPYVPPIFNIMRYIHFIYAHIFFLIMHLLVHMNL